MTLSLLPLLIYDEDVPARAREALRDALVAPAESRGAYLEAAASALAREASLECADARELVGLDGPTE
jgi:hypothetical protein